MAVYTTLVRNIVEEKAGLTSSKGYASVNDLITKAVPLIFDFDFPIFDERYRNVLCSKILKHYYMREIGTETYGLWHLYLDTTLNEIMPYYNKLYETELLKFNPLYDIDLRRTHNNKNDRIEQRTTGTNKTITEHNNNTTNTSNSGTGSGSSNNNNKTVNKYSDTPQGGLQNIENETYLTNATINNVNNNSTDSSKYSNSESTENTNDKAISDNGNINENGTINTTEDYIEIIQGKNGGKSYSELITEYRNTFLNIDAMIIDELRDLFMLIY